MVFYSLLDDENIPEGLRGKPKWVACLAIAIGILMIVLFAISIGAVIGYSYCYYEQRTYNITVYRVLNDTTATGSNVNGTWKNTGPRTINAAMKSVLIKTIITIGQKFVDGDEMKTFPWTQLEQNFLRQF